MATTLDHLKKKNEVWHLVCFASTGLSGTQLHNITKLQPEVQHTAAKTRGCSGVYSRKSRMKAIQRWAGAICLCNYLEELSVILWCNCFRGQCHCWLMSANIYHIAPGTVSFANCPFAGGALARNGSVKVIDHAEFFVFCFFSQVIHC